MKKSRFQLEHRASNQIKESIAANKRILTEIRENSVRLNNCPMHHFTYEKLELGQRLKCDNCGGQMQITDAGYYVKGYKAAGGDPENVWPGWEKKRVRKGDQSC